MLRSIVIFFIFTTLYTASLSKIVYSQPCKLGPTGNANMIINNQSFDYGVNNQNEVIRSAGGNTFEGRTANHIVPKVSFLKNFSRFLVWYRNNDVQNYANIRQSLIDLAVNNNLQGVNQQVIDNITYTEAHGNQLPFCPGAIAINSLITWLPRNIFISPLNIYRFWDPGNNFDRWVTAFVNNQLSQDFNQVHNNQNNHPYTNIDAQLFFACFIQNQIDTVYRENLNNGHVSAIFTRTVNNQQKPYCINIWTDHNLNCVPV